VAMATSPGLWLSKGLCVEQSYAVPRGARPQDSAEAGGLLISGGVAGREKFPAVQDRKYLPRVGSDRIGSWAGEECLGGRGG
jgi:hypothetical protein